VDASDEAPTRPERVRCRHRGCGVEIRQFNYGLGPEWLHIATNTDTGVAGQPYKICKTYTVATPPMTIGEWFGMLTGPRKRAERDDHEPG
jgi:hypothetical protein